MTEFMPENDVIIGKNMKESARDDTADNTGAAAEAVQPPLNDDKKKKKKSGAFGIFRAALYMLRKRPEEKEAAKRAINKQKSKGSKANWKTLVESMRPLHMQETPQSPLHQQPSPVPESMVEFFPPASPAASSSCGTLSQFASATSLVDLYNSDDEEEAEADPDEVFDAITGDEMIDAKAEEFIAQFYKQIQLQNTNTRQYQEDRGV